MKKLITIFFLSIITSSIAQPDISWSTCYGGSAEEVPFSIVATPTNEYLITGYTSSVDGNITNNYGGWADLWLIKINGSGSLIWQKTLGGTKLDEGFEIIATNDGGFIIAGMSFSTDFDATLNYGQSDFWIVKLNSNGEIQWQKSIGQHHNDMAHHIEQTTDGGYIVAGKMFSNTGTIPGHHGQDDIWIVKLDATGNVQWQNIYGGSGYETAQSIHSTTDGGYIIVGDSDSNDGDITASNGGKDFWIFKINSTGSLVWEKSLGGPGNDAATSSQMTTDSGLIITGYNGTIGGDVTTDHGGKDYWVVKTDNMGNILWQKSYGGSGDDFASSIIPAAGGGYLVSGWTDSTNGDVTINHGEYDYWIIKINAEGNLLWQESAGGTKDDMANFIYPTSEGGFIVGGSSLSNDIDVIGNHGDGTILTGDFWIIKYDAETAGTDNFNSNKVVTYPNPVKDVLNFSEFLSIVEIYTMDGKKLLEKQYTDKLMVDDLLKGVYVVKMRTADNRQEQSIFIKE